MPFDDQSQIFSVRASGSCSGRLGAHYERDGGTEGGRGGQQRTDRKRSGGVVLQVRLLRPVFQLLVNGRRRRGGGGGERIVPLVTSCVYSVEGTKRQRESR